MDSIPPAMFGFLVAVILGSLVLSPAIMIPLYGALVRFRAHYNPKGLRLDLQDDNPRTSLANPSYFGMLSRIYRIEGLSGLYKGLMPFLLSTLFLTGFLGVNNLRIVMRIEPYGGVANMVITFSYSIFVMLLFLPLNIITNRAITTPYKLPYFKAVYSLRVLLTPTERRRPWVLYLTPGLVIAKAAQISYFALLRLFRQMLLPVPMPSTKDFPFIWLKLGIIVVVALLSTLIITPLEVIVIRLSIQQNYATPELKTISREGDGDAGETLKYAGADEDATSLRTDSEPYVGLVDCAKKIIDEEGWSALYRAWYLTALLNLNCVF